MRLRTWNPRILKWGIAARIMVVGMFDDRTNVGYFTAFSWN